MNKNNSTDGSGDRNRMGLSRRLVWKLELQVKYEALKRLYTLDGAPNVGWVESRLRADPFYLVSVFDRIAEHLEIEIPREISE